LTSAAFILDRDRGRTFDDEDVALCYPLRAPYAPELYRFLLQQVAGRDRALDLGCGPGKIARVLADSFAKVEAVDPSGSLLRIGQNLDSGDHPNIRWIHATAEDAALDGPYDLITAGASLHWMDHAAVFPKLAASLRPQGLIAVVNGDGASAEAAWDDDWKVFLASWLERLGHIPSEAGFAAAVRSYEAWMQVEGKESFTYVFVQEVEDFITCQHSRETWARSKLGPELARAFDEELRALLEPRAKHGRLTFPVTSTLVWGRPLS
jgi:SAM-dependent methyltransferase